MKSTTKHNRVCLLLWMLFLILEAPTMTVWTSFQLQHCVFQCFGLNVMVTLSTTYPHHSPDKLTISRQYIGQETTADVCLVWRKWFWEYSPKVKVTKSVSKQVCAVSEGIISALQDCFDTTDWDMFKQTCNIHTVSNCFNSRDAGSLWHCILTPRVTNPCHRPVPAAYPRWTT